MEDTKSVPRPARRQETDNFVDDDELQASLAKSRRLKAKKTFNKMTPEMVAKNLAAQRAAEEAERAATGGVATPVVANGAAPAEGNSQTQDGQGGLTFDETSEFVRAIRERPVETEAPRRTRAVKEEPTDVELNGAVDVKREDSAEAADVPMHELDAANVKVEQDDEVTSDAVKQENEEGEALAGLAEAKASEEESEPIIGRGMAGTLSFLRQQGMMPQANPDLASREEQQRRYDAWLAARRLEERDRELARQASKASGSSLDQSTREAQNRNRELEEARLAQDRFRDYKPDVEIKYHDEFGRDLDAKEAWKHLSHVFHGNKPGTKKQEKRLKKIEDERKRERMAAGDTPTGMSQAFQSRSERTGKAHMVLSVGSRGSAPQENDLLDGKGMQLKKSQKPDGKMGKAKKAEGKAVLSPVVEPAAETGGDGAMTTTKTGGGWARVGSATPAPASNGTTPAAAAGGSGFKRITAADSTAAVDGGEGGKGVSTNGPFRLAFGGRQAEAEDQ